MRPDVENLLNERLPKLMKRFEDTSEDELGSSIDQSRKIRRRYTCKAPAKRSQHFNATYCNIVGPNMLRAFGHPIVMCCDMFGVVGSNLKLFKFFTQH